ncbi:Uncharacterized membrane protein YidH, DUF202 family [Metschnikowia aff. pulcherrima]|uniref:Uncharacterized membrane protein YidH, DUF202 family n=1 Tax=Metschnikowia aff. pulcherrima TaxID=2163413 RepID=A0A4P6XDR6_9ASCO|nr:Uncharacterized membrane protein YidH, DUF202 family [Metschnikowia aff. pulcherrima]
MSPANHTLNRRTSRFQAARSSESGEDEDMSNQDTKTGKVFTLMKNHLLILNNQGLVARDHLANERTYLAWTRTALVMMTLGLAFLQLYLIQARAHAAVYRDKSYSLDSAREEALLLVGKPFGVLIGVFALITMFIGFYRYAVVQLLLRHGEFPATRFLAVAVLLMCTLMMVLVLVMDIRAVM